MKIKNYYTKIITVLERLKKEFPNLTMGKHIATALDGHNIENVSDKDFFKAVNTYSIELEGDATNNSDIDKIIQDGLNLNNILEEDELELDLDYE